MAKIIIVALIALAANANAYMCKEVWVCTNGNCGWVTVCE